MNQQKKLSPAGTYIRETLLTILKALDVKHFDDLDIAICEMQAATTITVHAHADDQGKIVGGGGVMFNALETYFEIMGIRQGCRIRFYLKNPTPGAIGPRPPFQRAENWNNEAIRQLLGTLCKPIFEKPIEIIAEDGGDDFTGLTIGIESDDRMLSKATQLEDVLRVMFKAIGKVMGRNEVVVDLLKARV